MEGRGGHNPAKTLKPEKGRRGQVTLRVAAGDRDKEERGLNKP